MSSTRKRQTGGLPSFGNFFGRRNKTSKAEANLKESRDYKLRHAKSRVANYLGSSKGERKPGNFRYTNKDRIEKEFEDALQKLKEEENPKDIANASKTLLSELEKGIYKLNTQGTRTAAAITITLPIGIAQLLIKVLKLAFFALGMVFPPLLAFMDSKQVDSLMNMKFNTTKEIYGNAKNRIGVRNSPLPPAARLNEESSFE
jgi:hypothetical protein